MQPYIREGLYKEVEHRQLWNKLIDINNRYCVFDKNEKQIILKKMSKIKNIYEMLDAKTRELKAKGIEGKTLKKKWKVI